MERELMQLDNILAEIKLDEADRVAVTLHEALMRHCREHGGVTPRELGDALGQIFAYSLLHVHCSHHARGRQAFDEALKAGLYADDSMDSIAFH